MLYRNGSVLLAGLLSAFLFLNGGAGASEARMERNSFLNMPANSVQDLVAQVATHPRVALRYSKHFGRTDGQVVSFFSKNLRKERLKTDRIAQVYYYTKDGRIYSKMSRLKAGTLVFATLKRNSRSESVVRQSGARAASYARAAGSRYRSA